MCILCNDDAAYEAYMAYLDAMQKQRAAADPDKADLDKADLDRAMDAALDAMMANTKAEDNALSVHYVSGPAPARKPNTPPKNPFSCDPVDE